MTCLPLRDECVYSVKVLLLPKAQSQSLQLIELKVAPEPHGTSRCFQPALRKNLSHFACPPPRLEHPSRCRLSRRRARKIVYYSTGHLRTVTFIRAITIPNKAKNAVKETHSGYLNHPGEMSNFGNCQKWVLKRVPLAGRQQ